MQKEPEKTIGEDVWDRNRWTNGPTALHYNYVMMMTMMCFSFYRFNPLTPNDHYSGRTAPLTSKRCILYIYSTNTGTEYLKHGIYSPFFFSLFKMQFVS